MAPRMVIPENDINENDVVILRVDPVDPLDHELLDDNTDEFDFDEFDFDEDEVNEDDFDEYCNAYRYNPLTIPSDYEGPIHFSPFRQRNLLERIREDPYRILGINRDYITSEMWSLAIMANSSFIRLRNVYILEMGDLIEGFSVLPFEL
jgi:hypothetical protein